MLQTGGFRQNIGDKQEVYAGLKFLAHRDVRFLCAKKQGGLEAHKPIRFANPARLSDEDFGTAEGISLVSAR